MMRHVLLALMLAGTAAAAPVQLSAYQDNAHDLSQWRSELLSQGLEVRNTAATPLFLSEVADPAHTVFVVAGMERTYSQKEKDAIATFVEKGGAVLFGDSGGSVPNSFSKDYGVLYFGTQLLDRFEFNQSFVRASVPSWEATPLFVRPTALLCRTEACQAGILAQSSTNNSFLDLNRNGLIDASDDVGPFTMMVMVERGAGRVLFLPTAAFATNDAVRDVETSLFLDRMLAEVAPDARFVVIDESRHLAPDGEALFVAALTVLGGFVSSWLPRALVAATFAVAAAFILRRAEAFLPWGHAYAPDAPTDPPVRSRSAGQRLADLLRMKIKIDHQLVEPIDPETYLEHAPDEESRRVLRHPDHIHHDQIQRLLRLHFAPEGGTSSPVGSTQET